MTAPHPTTPPVASRRSMLALGTGALASLVVRPAAATPEALRAAIAEFTKGATAQPGRVRAIRTSHVMRSKISCDTRRSEITNDACFNTRNACNVNSSGSPGPAPTKATFPSAAVAR